MIVVDNWAVSFLQDFLRFFLQRWEILWNCDLSIIDINGFIKVGDKNLGVVVRCLRNKTCVLSRVWSGTDLTVALLSKYHSTRNRQRQRWDEECILLLFFLHDLSARVYIESSQYSTIQYNWLQNHIWNSKVLDKDNIIMLKQPPFKTERALCGWIFCSL